MNIACYYFTVALVLAVYFSIGEYRARRGITFHKSMPYSLYVWIGVLWLPFLIFMILCWCINAKAKEK